MSLVPIEPATVICDARADHCHCVLEPDHSTDVHRCTDECGGSWRGTWDADFEPVTMPNGGIPVRDLMLDILGGPLSFLGLAFGGDE